MIWQGTPRVLGAVPGRHLYGRHRHPASRPAWCMSAIAGRCGRSCRTRVSPSQNRTRRPSRPCCCRKRALTESRPVAYYLPEMAGTAYEHATLRQVLDMQIGVAYSETYSDPTAEILGLSTGRRPQACTGRLPRTGFHDFLRTLRNEGEHGGAFAYKTVNTEVLCWVIAAGDGNGFPYPVVEPALVTARLRRGWLCRGRLEGESPWGGCRARGHVAGPRPVRRHATVRGGDAQSPGRAGRGGCRYPARWRPREIRARRLSLR